jgi:energy-coupling factor transporter ATP-binding protein EcfA2
MLVSPRRAVMKKVGIALENCYGIKKLDYQFDFSSESVYAIYAPNGSMKSSLAQTFKDIAEGTASKDRIFPARVSVRKITDENGAALPPQSILVLPPYDEVFSHNERTSLLLVNDKLRKEYEQLHLDIEQSKDALLKALKAQSGSKKDLEKEVSFAFMAVDNKFLDALKRISAEVLRQKDAPFANVKYDTIFDEKVISFLNTKDFKTAIADYITRYNELLAASTYFKKGIFEYYNAATIAKSLADNGFFDAKHTVSFNNGKKVEINTLKQLEDMIAKEKDAITKDKDLKKKFAELEKLITKNATVRDFQAYLTSNETLLPHLEHIAAFKQDIWKSYLKVNSQLLTDLIAKDQAAADKEQKIVEQATKERTLWEKVIDIFNDRFFVPFKLRAKNREAVILGDEPILSLEFIFEDEGGHAQVERTTLLQALSQGEKKALYVLNIMFEVETRRKEKRETLFVVDDVADSFDYRNKYAIIEYLKDIATEPTFRQIILTHNFDFFRTLNARLHPALRSAHCLMVTKNGGVVSFQKAKGIQNVFVKDWKPHFFTDQSKKIAAITFTRNIIEYTKGTTDADYVTLTALLHWKAETPTILEEHLNGIYIGVFGVPAAPAVVPPATHKPAIDIIDEEAKAVLAHGGAAKFEEKIVLAIAIRMTAERFMVAKIADQAFVKAIERNQTTELLDKFEKMFPKEDEAIKTLRGVVLMTPENIHLNSFMYEPIVDMSDEHLKKLYKAVLALH